LSLLSFTHRADKRGKQGVRWDAVPNVPHPGGHKNRILTGSQPKAYTCST
jgi:hypothetical protein